MDRVKKLASQLGKPIGNMAGKHMPHVVVGVVRNRRKKKENPYYKGNFASPTSGVEKE